MKAVPHTGPGFDAGELPPLQSLEDAMTCLDSVRVAVLTGKITTGQGTSAAKTISEWVRANTALTTAHVVGELRAELERKGREIETLRKALVRR